MQDAEDLKQMAIQVYTTELQSQQRKCTEQKSRMASLEGQMRGFSSQEEDAEKRIGHLYAELKAAKQEVRKLQSDRKALENDIAAVQKAASDNDAEVARVKTLLGILECPLRKDDAVRLSNIFGTLHAV